MPKAAATQEQLPMKGMPKPGKAELRAAELAAALNSQEIVTGKVDECRQALLLQMKEDKKEIVRCHDQAGVLHEYKYRVLEQVVSRRVKQHEAD